MRASMVLMTLIIPLSAAMPGAQAPTAGPAGQADRGKSLYLARGCWTCHGYAAHGGAGSGPRLAGRLPPWAGFVKYVRHPDDEMIPYTDRVITDQQLADIYAWLRTIPPPPKVDSLTQLKD